MPSITITNSGSGPQNATTGNGAQYNNNGSGGQYNSAVDHSGDGRSTAPNLSNRDGNKLGSNRGGPLKRKGFTVAVVCALPLESDAVSLLFDETWDEEEKDYGRAYGDENVYTFGRIGHHDVVLVLLPNIGSSIAAGSAASLRSSFPGLKLALLVGICGGAPGTGPDERLLGDVVVSKSIRHDIGKQYPGEIVMKDTDEDTLPRPSKIIRSVAGIFETETGRRDLKKKTVLYLEKLRTNAKKEDYQTSYEYPGVDKDKLFPADYQHDHRVPHRCDTCSEVSHGFCRTASEASCTDLCCDTRRLVSRKRLETKRRMQEGDKNMDCPKMFLGSFASGNTLMKSGEHRDVFASKHHVIAFEMEGAGMWDEVSTIVIKGISDYADSHKNKVWQPFAAGTAAATMRAFLGFLPRTDPA